MHELQDADHRGAGGSSFTVAFSLGEPNVAKLVVPEVVPGPGKVLAAPPWLGAWPGSMTIGAGITCGGQLDGTLRGRLDGRYRGAAPRRVRLQRQHPGTGGHGLNQAHPDRAY
jgi:hypothetical protein